MAAAVLSLCLVGALAFQGIQKAQAASFDPNATGTISVAVSNNASGAPGESAPEQPNNLYYKLYKVAAAVQDPGYDSFTFEALAPFGELVGNLSDGSMSADRYKTIAQSAAQVIANATPPVEPTFVAPASTPLPNVATGLYLMVAYSQNEGNAGNANVLESAGAPGSTVPNFVSYGYSDTKKFTFSPELVSVPTKAPNADGTINTANPGEWLYEQTVTLKPAITQRTGSLAINKELPTFEQVAGATTNQATFVFDIKGYATQADAVAAQNDPSIKPVYTNVASVTFDGAGSQQAVVTNIPAGIYVVVTEVYSGTTYEPAPIDGATEGYIIATDGPDGDSANPGTKPLTVSFRNAYTPEGTPNKGGSVTNSFQLGEDGGWTWSKDGVDQTPQNGPQGGDQ